MENIARDHSRAWYLQDMAQARSIPGSASKASHCRVVGSFAEAIVQEDIYREKTAGKHGGVDVVAEKKSPGLGDIRRMTQRPRTRTVKVGRTIQELLR